jgi:hypothetical protein
MPVEIPGNEIDMASPQYCFGEATDMPIGEKTKASIFQRTKEAMEATKLPDKAR